MAEASISLKCSDCPTRSKCEWRSLGQEEVEILDKAKVTLSYDRGQTIFMEEDDSRGVYCIASGTVSVFKTNEDGDTAVLRLSRAGETLGYGSVLAGRARTTNAEAILPSRICFIPRKTVLSLVARNSELALGFLNHSLEDFRDVGQRYLQLATGTVRSRLGHLLESFRASWGAEDGNGGLVIDLPVSNRDIASLIETRPESLSRTIRKLKSDGLAEFNSRSVKIADPSLFFASVETVGNC